MVSGLSAGRCIQPEASCASARCRAPVTAYASMARPVYRAFRASLTLYRPVIGPGADRICSSRHPGPGPYRPQRPVPHLRARSRLDRLGSSRATRARSRLGRTGSSRPPGPEPFGDRPLLRWALGLRVLGPYFALGPRPRRFCAGRSPYDGQSLTLRWAATPRRLVPLT